jgi:hypothetical protein
VYPGQRVHGYGCACQARLYVHNATTGEVFSGAAHFVNTRVQGALRSYEADLTANGKLGPYKNENGYRLLTEADFDWETGKSYTITVKAEGATLTIYAGNASSSFILIQTIHTYVAV